MQPPKPARVVDRIVHLSDVHLGAHPDQEVMTLEPLVRTLGSLRAAWGAPPRLLALTGDVYDTAGPDPREASERFVALVTSLRRALDDDVPTVVVPGNHDRRTAGLLLPFRTNLVEAFGRAGLRNVIVGGRELPFLGELVDDAFHRLPFAVALVDSSYTPAGLVSAGGLLRVEDLLEIAQGISARGDDPHRPLVLLTHHHLVPTPVTDVSRLEADTSNPVLLWLAKNALSGLVSYADHEEWMMTALGAGSFLSTLQSLGRPVFVLHGHKHYPTVRLLEGTLEGHGDVVLLSAGSAGLAMPLDAGEDDEGVARLWPSFHVLELEDGDVRVRTVAYLGSSPHASRELLHVRQDRARWHVHPVSDRIVHEGPRLRYNRSELTLRECAGRSDARWDVVGVRRVLADSPLTYREHVRAAPDSQFADPRLSIARAVDLPTDGTPFEYRVLGGVVRTVREALRVYGPTDPFERAELHCRYEADVAQLALYGLPRGARPFGSVVDLTRGRVTPHALDARADGGVELVAHHCPPRAALRIQWRPE